MTDSVTPCVGVWIETFSYFIPVLMINSHTLRGCVDWNVEDEEPYAQIEVTPCVGVWIETGHTINYDCGAESHPAWVCGLKH